MKTVFLAIPLLVLAASAQARDVILLVQSEIVDTRLDSRIKALLPVSLAQVIASSDRAVDDVR